MKSEDLLKVLLIDSNKSVRLAINCMFETDKIQIDWTPNLESIFEHIKNEYNLIILDPVHSERTPVETVLYVKIHFPNTPLIVLSSLDLSTDIDKTTHLKEAGAIEILEKHSIDFRRFKVLLINTAFCGQNSVKN